MKILLTVLTLATAFSSYAQEHQLMVGMSGLDMKPKIGIPLAGYGDGRRRQRDFVDWRFKDPEATLFKPSEGYHSPIRAKVMALKKGDQNLIFVSLDTIGIEDRLVKALAKRLKSYNIKEKDLIVSATHTHGGPGTLSTRLPLQLVAVDFYKHKNYMHIVNKVTESIKFALDHQRPAELFKSKAIINDVQENKWRRIGEGHYDKRASFLVAKDAESGEWLGGLVNFSIHGGTMPIEIMLYSSDINGAIEKELEQNMAEKNPLSFTSPVFLFMNGAEGDVAGKGERAVESISSLSKKFIEQAAPALEANALTPVAPEFSSKKKRLFVGIPHLVLNKCEQDGALLMKLPEWVKPVLYPMFPAKSYVSIATVGDITYITWPGEPSTQLGYDLQAMATEMGHADPIVLSLTNDYMSYFNTKSEYFEKTYDSCSNTYGYEGGERILKAHKDWL